jgi:general secretion pathway protein K
MPIERTTFGKSRERGWALVSVLWSVTMLSLLAAATQELTITAHRAEHRAWDSARADAALEAGVVQAVAGISGTSGRWRVDGVPRQESFEGFRLRIAVQDEAGRFDLNAVDGSILTALLRSAGLESELAAALSDTILDWRSPAGPHRLNGASDDDYAAAGLSYRPRHGAFQTVDELRLVLGMTPELFRRIRPALTVYTKRAMIDPALAPKEALLALYAGNEDAVEAILQARASGGEIPSELYLNSRDGVINPGVSLTGQAFTIAVETILDERSYRRTAVVMLTGDDKQPYLTLWWSNDT